VVVDGGGEPRLSLCSILSLRESRRVQGRENFPPPHFVLFPLFASADGPGGRKLYGIGFCSFSACGGLKSGAPQ
jgi:hypothetical protein